jgi:hypothetical protein
MFEPSFLLFIRRGTQEYDLIEFVLSLRTLVEFIEQIPKRVLFFLPRSMELVDDDERESLVRAAGVAVQIPTHHHEDVGVGQQNDLISLPLFSPIPPMDRFPIRLNPEFASFVSQLL